MIRLTRRSGAPFVVNAELIRTVEETPDTIVTLQGGEKLLVLEDADTVVARVIDYQRSVRLPTGPA